VASIVRPLATKAISAIVALAIVAITLKNRRNPNKTAKQI
jgi:hypothetical protein